VISDDGFGKQQLAETNLVVG